MSARWELEIDRDADYGIAIELIEKRGVFDLGGLF